MRKRSTRGTIVGLFGLTGEDELTTGDLVRLSSPLGITATNLKSHLTRMVADGSLKRRGVTRRSRYSPRAPDALLAEDVGARVAQQLDPWNGRWITLAVRWPRSRQRRSRLRHELNAAGFRTWNGATWLRPDWPPILARTCAAELSPTLRGVWTVGEVPTRAERERLVALYSLDTLDRRARALLERADEHVARSGSARAALVGRRRMAEELRALLREDPCLPREMWGKHRTFLELLERFARVDQRLERDSRAFVAAALRRAPAAANTARVALEAKRASRGVRGAR